MNANVDLDASWNVQSAAAFFFFFFVCFISDDCHRFAGE